MLVNYGIYWILDLENEVHSIWVGVGQGQGKPRSGAEAIVFSVLPLPVALMRAMLVGGI